MIILSINADHPKNVHILKLLYKTIRLGFLFTGSDPAGEYTIKGMSVLTTLILTTANKLAKPH